MAKNICTSLESHNATAFIETGGRFIHLGIRQDLSPAAQRIPLSAFDARFLADQLRAIADQIEGEGP